MKNYKLYKFFVFTLFFIVVSIPTAVVMLVKGVAGFGMALLFVLVTSAMSSFICQFAEERSETVSVASLLGTYLALVHIGFAFYFYGTIKLWTVFLAPLAPAVVLTVYLAVDTLIRRVKSQFAKPVKRRVR